MRIKRRPNDAYEVGRYFKVADFDGAHILPAELADEIAELKNDVLASPRLLVSTFRTANIIGRQENDCEVNIRVILELLDNSATLVGLFTKNYGYEVDFPQNPATASRGSP